MSANAECGPSATPTARPIAGSIFEQTRASLQLLPWAIVFMVPAAFQFMYGVHDLGLLEEWGIQQVFDIRGTVFWTAGDANGIEGLAGQAIRPLTVAPHSIAFLLDNDSFVWYHVLNGAALGLKGLAMMALLLQMRLRRSVAVAGAVIFALFPAWTGLFTFRMIHAQFAIAALTMATALFIAYVRRPTVVRAVAMSCLLAMSLLLYEVGYIAVALVPLMLFFNFRIPLRAFLRRTAVWFVVPFVNGIRIVLLLRSGRPLYERDLVTTSARRPTDEAIDLARLTYKQGLAAFFDAPMSRRISWSVIFFTALVVLAGVAAVHFRGRTRGAGDTAQTPSTPQDGSDDPARDKSAFEQRPSDRRLVVLMVAMLAAGPIVALIYATNPAHLTDPLRVFSIASLPLAVFFAAAVELLSRRKLIAGHLLLALLVFGALTADAGQRDDWHERSMFQEHVVGAIAEARTFKPDANEIVVVDPEHLIGAGGDVYRFLPVSLRQAVEYMDPLIIQVLVCSAPLDQLPESTTPTPTSSCWRTAGTVASDLGTANIATAAVIEIRATRQHAWPQGDLKLPNHRMRSLLHCVAEESCDSGANGIEARLIETATQP
jgi:hypothetical protein